MQIHIFCFIIIHFPSTFLLLIEESIYLDIDDLNKEHDLLRCQKVNYVNGKLKEKGKNRSQPCLILHSAF